MPSPAVGLTLRLHGPAAVQFADGRVFALEGRGAAVVALVALERDARRDRVAALLWPDSDDPRRNLRQQLLRLKQALDGVALVEGDDVLRLAAGAVLASGVDAAPLLGTQQFDDSPDFQDWLDERRARQRDVSVRALEAEAAAAEAAGRHDDALAIAQKLLSVEEQAEAHHRLVMRLHYLRGDRAAGLAAYERLERWLQARHGLAPDAATQSLARSLRESSTALVPSRPVAMTTVPVTVMRPPRLIGRDDALAALRAAWESHRAALVLGEPGLGKSRLLAEFSDTVRVAWAAGRPGDAGVPYATLARLLRRLRELHEPVQTPPQAAALACVLPEWAAASSSPATGIGDVRLAMLAAIEAWLADAQQHDLAALVLDDLHFADAASIEAIQTLIGSEALSGLRFALAARPNEIGAAGEALRSALVEARLLDEIALQPLTVEQITALVSSLILPELDAEALGPQLARHSGGNPLYALETLKLGLVDGSLRNGALPRPGQVGALIERRLQRLSESATTLSRVAAIAGVDFSIELAEAATGQRAVQLASAWQELQDAQVLHDECFAHDLVADAALRSVPPVVARRVHAQCAQWLATHGGEPARVAWHWCRGGQPAEAGRAFMAAAKRAERAARVREEAELCGHAAQAFADAGMEQEAFDARLLRVRALNGIAFDDEARQEVHALIESATTDPQRMHAHTELCGLHTERSEPQAALEAGRAALALARSLGSMEWQVRIGCHMASALCRLGRSDEAMALLAPQRAWVMQQPDPELRMLWHGDWAAVLGCIGQLRNAIAAFDVALAASREYGSRDAEGQLMLNCAVTLRNAGQLDRSLAMARAGHHLSVPERSQAEALPIGRLVVARDASETGQYAEALTELDATLAEFERRHASFWVQAARMVLARMWLDLGQFARALPLLGDDAADLPAWLQADRRLLRLDLAVALESPPPAGLLDQALALTAQDVVRGPALQVRAMRHQDAAVVLAKAGPLGQALRAGERYGAWMTLQVHRARAALAMGDGRAAAEAARAVLGAFDEGIAPEGMYRAEAWWVAQQALAAHGDLDAADRALRAADQWLRQVALPQVPATYLDSFLHRNAANRALLAASAASARDRLN